MITGLFGALALMTSPMGQPVDVTPWERCQADGAPAWLLPKPSIDRVLQVQSVADMTSSAELRLEGPQRPALVGDVVEYLEGLSLPSIDVLVAGRGAYNPGFGPAEPGVYRVDLADRGDPGCEAYLAYLERIRPLALEAGFEADFAPAGKCVRFSFVSARPDLQKYSHFIVDYVDESARRAGYFRYVSELRGRSDDVYARAVTYVFEPPSKSTCDANASAIRLSQFLKGSN